MSKHDQLQAAAFQWTQNTFPQFRNLIFAARSEVIRYPGETEKQFLARLGHLKSIGHRKGILDLHIDFPEIEGIRGAPFEFDAKIKPDYLKPEQHERIASLERCGGGGFAFHSFEEYQDQFYGALAKVYGRGWSTMVMVQVLDPKVNFVDDAVKQERKKWIDRMRREI